MSETAFRIRSYGRRGGRITANAARSYEQLWQQYGLSIDNGLIDSEKIFANANLHMEIGFGSGRSLLALAAARPDCHFIGIETYRPAIAALLLGADAASLTNLHVYDADAIDVLTHCIGDEMLAGVQIFFPDPWPKRRHHARRLIRSEFIQLLLQKLKSNADLHLATDWEDYAQHMMRVLSATKGLINVAGAGSFAPRSPFRPVVTKFEQRALTAGRPIWDLQFVKSDREHPSLS